MNNDFPKLKKISKQYLLDQNAKLLTAAISAFIGFVCLSLGLFFIPVDLLINKWLLLFAIYFAGLGSGYIGFKIDFLLHSRKLFLQANVID